LKPLPIVELYGEAWYGGLKEH